MKSCLKHSPPSTRPSTPAPTRPPYSRKSVSFCKEGEEQVFIADEWDRTPAEVAQKLSYQDVLELKQLQLSLPRAPQPPDPYSTRPQFEYLRRVPIRLMPLLPETEPSPATTPPATTPPADAPSTSQPPIRQPHAQSPPTTTHWLTLASPLTSPSMSPQHSPKPSPAPSPIPSNLPPRAPLRPRPHFAFLPLLPTAVADEPSGTGPEAEPGEVTFNWNDDGEEEGEGGEEKEEEDIARTPHSESTLERQMLSHVFHHDADADDHPSTSDVPSSSASTSDGELTADESTPSLTTCSLSPSPSPPILIESDASQHLSLTAPADSYFQIPTARAGAGAGLGEGLPYALKKLRLQGLPSPALTPPSPFDLYGPGMLLGAEGGGEGEREGKGRLEDVQAFERRAGGGGGAHGGSMRRGAGRRVASTLGLSVVGKGAGVGRAL